VTGHQNPGDENVSA